MIDWLLFGVVGAVINAHFGPFWAMLFCTAFPVLLYRWYCHATR